MDESEDRRDSGDPLGPAPLVGYNGRWPTKVGPRGSGRRSALQGGRGKGSGEWID